MKAASVKEIKTELSGQSPEILLNLCLRLARFKKENKELLTYLLFEAHNEPAFIESVKSELDLQFEELNIKNLYIAKKNLRKSLRTVNKFIRYSGSTNTEASLLIYFCKKIISSGIKMEKSTALINLYNSQLKKIRTAIAGLHEDLQYDYEKELKDII